MKKYNNHSPAGEAYFVSSMKHFEKEIEYRK